MIATRCPWYIAGPLSGFFSVVLRAMVNKPFAPPEPEGRVEILAFNRGHAETRA